MLTLSCIASALLVVSFLDASCIDDVIVPNGMFGHFLYSTWTTGVVQMEQLVWCVCVSMSV